MLECPRCGARYETSARFCERCRLPLVMEGADLERSGPIDERHEWARKIKPQLAEGELVKVARARNQAEAEFIQSLLLDEGVPSLLRRSAGFDVPDFLAAGPRDVMVPLSGAEVAREVLLQAEIVVEGPAPRTVAPARLALGLLAALAVGALVVVLFYLAAR